MTCDTSRRGLLKGLFATSAVALMPFGAVSEAFAASSVDAVRAALRGDFSNAGALAQQSGDEAAIKLVELIYLRDHGREVGFQRIRDFQAAAPKWPLSETLMKRAEQALFYTSESPETVLTYFNDHKPLTGDGHAALARAHYSLGNDKEGKASLRRAWANTEMEGDTETRIAKEFAGRLTASDQRLRLQRLILAQSTGAALRHAKRTGGDGMRIAQVGQALIKAQGGAEKQYNALPAGLRNDPALRYALARFYRKQEKYGKARSILLNAPSTAAEMVDANAWWEERRIIARRSIGPNHRDSWNAAYKIARNHGIASGVDAVEAEFLAGWIALRFLKDANTGLAHFENLTSLADSRTEKARGGYWMGRAHAALGNDGAANKAYKSAAVHSTIYYGQLAREQIGLGKVPEEINSGESSSSAKSRIEQDQVMRALRLMHKASGKDNLHMFLYSLASRFKSPDEMNAVAAAMQSLGGTMLSLKLAKLAGQFKVDIDAWAYPLRGMPDWKQIGKPVEKALVFGLARQESEFNPNAGSKVGARGLMQLMPGTAKLVARQYRLPYSPGKLTDPHYNVKLGAAHLADLVEDFGGSYVLTLVAYNAGPRRAKEWTEEFGDLRSGQVDPIDWVENIPFQETRQYVQKVMQNLHIYRSRLAPKTVRPMSVDLKRGRPGSADAITTATVEPATECKGIASLITGCE
jgi:soluble lytic murein transglycosylase